MLRRSGLSSHVTVPLSAGLLADTDGYVEALQAYRAGDPRPVVDELVRASQHAAGIGTPSMLRPTSGWSSKREPWDSCQWANRRWSC